MLGLMLSVYKIGPPYPRLYSPEFSQPEMKKYWGENSKKFQKAKLESDVPPATIYITFKLYLQLFTFHLHNISNLEMI